MATIFTTARLLVRHVERADAPFMRALLNDPGFLANIGDRGVRTKGEAEDYIAGRMHDAYATPGFGMFVVEDGGTAVGVCGFVDRDGLDAPDLGFAYLAERTRRGYGLEAGAAMLRWGRATAGFGRVLAVTEPRNAASIALLGRLGFVEIAGTTLPGRDAPSRLFENIAEPVGLG